MLYLSIECDNSAHAYELERFLKAMKSPKLLQKMRNDTVILQSIKEKCMR
jgi:hypothetical protein